MSRLRLLLAVSITALTALPALPAPQTNPPAATDTTASSAAPDGGVPTYIRPETAAQRAARLGTSEDPGINPDPNKHYWRYGKSFHIEKFDRRFASYEHVDEGWVKPFARVSASREIYQQNDKYVWVWTIDPESVEAQEAEVAATPAPTSPYQEQQIKVLRGLMPEFSVITPDASEKVIRFEAASSGLPTSGSWRNSPAVADMNGDGKVDLIVPAERGGNGMPRIFLGDGAGHWKYWSDVKWPRRVDYGTVVAADFNRDGHMDLAFGVHLNGVVAMLGDGKGTFTDASKGLPRDFPTRRIAIVDANRDGYPDIAAVSEGPSTRNAAAEYAKLRVYLNPGKSGSWTGLNVTDPRRQFGGDWLATADFNGDKLPDFASSSIFFGSGETMYVSTAPKKWRVVDTPGVVPFYSYYLAVGAGRFTSPTRDDAVVSFMRSWPQDVGDVSLRPPSITNVVGIDRVTFAGKQPKRVPIVRWQTTKAIMGLATGDFDHDGNLDIIYTRWDPREADILLGDGKGGFRSATVEGLNLRLLSNYDITVADVNADGLPDVIVMYESAETTGVSMRNGSVEVFLNRGATTATASK